MSVFVADIESESIVDGPGFRFAIYVQGCPHDCPGCHNPQTHEFGKGHELSPERILKLLDDSPLNTGVTLTGGEPMCQAAELIPFARKVREQGMSLWVYSGYTYEQLMGDAPMSATVAEHIDLPAAQELLGLCDVLVDGRFVKARSSYDAKWRGSTNQRVIDLKKTREAGELVLVEGTAQVRRPRNNRDFL